MWYLDTFDYIPPWVEVQPPLKEVFQVGKQEMEIQAGVHLLKVCSLSTPARCREAVEGAYSTATHSHQHMMPQHLCVKKCSRIPQTPPILVLGTSKHVFSRRRKGTGFSAGQENGHWSWGPGWECFLILFLEQAVIHYQHYPQSLLLDQISNKLSTFSSMKLIGKRDGKGGKEEEKS